MKRAVTYSRVSAFDKHGDSIESQIEMCGEYATQNGYSVVTHLHDHNVSGADMSAPALERALLMAERGEFDVLVTRELDRFARSLAKQLFIEKEFRDNGVTIEYVIGDYEDNPEGLLTKNVRAVIAEYERLKITERMTRGRYRSARRGTVFVTTVAPYGYRAVMEENDGRERKTLVVEEEEAEIVRKIFHWYVYDLLSFNAIAAKLTEMRVPTAGDKNQVPRRKVRAYGLWDAAFIRKVIMRRAYIGEWIYNTKVGDITVSVPAIVDHGIHAKAQKRRLQARAASRRNTKYEYLLRGRAFCAKCGYRLHAITRPSASAKNAYHYYRCPGARRHKTLTRSCKSVMYRSDHADALVWDEICKILSNPTAFGYEEDDETQHIGERIDNVDQRIMEAEARIERLAELYEVGRRTLGVVIERQRKLEREIKRLENDRAELLAQLDDAVARQAHADDVQRLAAELTDLLEVDAADFEARRHLIEILDVSVRMETFTKKDKRAHIDIGSRYYATVRIIPNS